MHALQFVLSLYIDYPFCSAKDGCLHIGAIVPI